MRTSILALRGGVQWSALGGAGAAARGRRLPLAALRSRGFSSYPTAAETTDQTPPDPRAQTRPASTRARGAYDLASGRITDAPPGRENHPDAIELAWFAVDEYNSKAKAQLEFVRIVKVRGQLVAGLMNYLTLEVREVDGGANKLYEAKVWIRPWENFRGLHAFEPVADAA